MRKRTLDHHMVYFQYLNTTIYGKKRHRTGTSIHTSITTPTCFQRWAWSQDAIAARVRSAIEGEPEESAWGQANAGPEVTETHIDFFTAAIRNRNTRQAYARAY